MQMHMQMHMHMRLCMWHVHIYHISHLLNVIPLYLL